MIAACGLLLSSQVPAAWSEEPRRILLLNSYHQGFPWTDGLVRGASDTLTKGLKNVELYVEYMDTKRLYSDESFAIWENLLRHKFAAMPLDAILCADDNALRFLLAKHENLFGDTPVVFSGINDFKEEMLEGETAFTGVVETLDVKSTIDLALRLHPDTRQIHVISDGTPTGHGTREVVVEAARDYPQLTFHYLNGEDLTTDELLAKLRALPDQSLTLMVIWLRDREGHYKQPAEILPLIAAASRAPVYGLNDLWLGLGIVGGRLSSSAAQGQQAAEIALRILTEGCSPADIPVQQPHPQTYMFDYKQLARWGIHPADVPPDSMIINEPFSLYREYRTVIWASAGVVALLTFLVIVLAVSILRRRRVENSLRDLSSRYWAILASIPDIVVEVDRDLKHTWANRAGLDFFGEDVLGKAIDHYTEDETGTSEQFKTLLDGQEQALYVESWQRRKDGVHRLLAWWCRALKDARGDVAKLLCTARDITERRQVEEAVRASEERLRTLVETAPSVILSLDPEGRILEFNPEAERVFGKRRGEVLGQSYYDLFLSSDSREAIEADIHEVLAGKSTRSLENTVQSANDESRVLIWNIERLLDAHGEPIGIIAIGQDVTAQKQAKAELATAQSLLRASVEQTPAGILIADAPDVRIRIANSAALGIRGGTADSLTDIPAELHPERWQTFHPDGAVFRPEDLPLSRAILEGRESKNVEVVIRRADGEERWVLANAAPVRDADGEIVAGVVVFPDITEMKKAEKQLRLTQFSVDHSADLAFWITPDARFIHVSETACRSLGYTREELLSLTVHDVDPDYPEETWANHWQDLKRHGTLVIESRHRAKDGRVFPVEITLNFLEFEGREYNFAFARDITDRRQAQEEKQKLESQLRQAQKMEAVGRLAGGVAHDFNNILTAILGNAEALRNDLRGQAPPEDTLFQSLDQIDRASQRAASLTRQLLMFSRREIVQPEILDPNRLVSDLEKMLRRLIGEDITLTLSLGATQGKVRGDAGQIEQVIVNLAVNARDAMPEGGRLTLETVDVVLDETYALSHAEARPGPHVQIAVSDTGCGMSQEILDQIFEPFFTTKHASQGTGLGLAMVYGIIKQAGGHIVVYSEVDHGTTFRVYLPAVDAPATEHSRSGEADRALTGTETVLVCEDDETVRHLTARFLEGAGYKVLATERGEHALDIANQHIGPIHLLVTDVIMPGINGKQLSEALTAERPDLHTLFISGYTSNVIAHHGMLEEGTELLEKPFGRRSLLDKVRALLDKGAEERHT